MLQKPSCQLLCEVSAVMAQDSSSYWPWFLHFKIHRTKRNSEYYKIHRTKHNSEYYSQVFSSNFFRISSSCWLREIFISHIVKLILKRVYTSCFCPLFYFCDCIMTCIALLKDIYFCLIKYKWKKQQKEEHYKI